MTANARPIRGVYYTRSDLSDAVNGYQFTNADRNAYIHYATNINMSFTLKAIEDHDTYRTVHFGCNNKFTINRARLSTPGADGLKISPNHDIAARLELYSVDYVSQTLLGDSPVVIEFSKFNEWEDFKLSFISRKAIAANEDYTFICGDSKLYVDDYNLQTAYVGQTFGLVLEMEIDTAGMIIDYSGRIV